MKKYAAILITLVLFAATAAAAPPPIFDGKSLDNWMTEKGDPAPKGWEVKDGVIHLNREAGKSGHIITRAEYGNFDLTFAWKIAKAGNSGVKYRVKKYDGKWLGLEYQVLDDPNTKEGTNPEKIKNTAGSLYDIKEPSDKKRLKPTGEYNTTRIRVQDNSIKHWLNGELIVSITVGSEDWKKRIADSKFKKHDAFSENKLGKIMLTDHGADVWYKDLKLTPLP